MELLFAGLVAFAVVGGAHKLADLARERGSQASSQTADRAWALLWLALTVFVFLAVPLMIEAFGDAAQRQQQPPYRPYVPR